MQDKDNNIQSNTQSTQNMQSGDNFPLYTEKIVVNPFVRYKKIFGFLRLIIMAVVFGLIAAAVMAWAYPKFAKENNQPVDNNKDALVLDKDEYPSDAIMDETKPGESESHKETKPVQKPVEDNPIETEPVLSYVELLEKIQKSIVVIADTVKVDESLPAVPGEERITDTVGVVIGELAGRYMVLTSYTEISALDEKVVKIGNEAEVKGTVVSFDTRTDLALVAFSKYELTDYEKTLVSVAQLDNSYTVKQGDAFVAAGKLYGKLKSADKGFVTSVTTEMVIDNCYGVINAGLRVLEGDYCFLFNGKGNVIGISKLVSKEPKFVANGTSDLKSLIEKLSVDADIIYLGIRGTNVTSSMVTNYKLPYGIYITDVIIDSPAFYAGLQVGDVITAVDGSGLFAMQQLSDKLYNCTIGQQIILNVKRQSMTGYKDMTFTATLGTRK